ncbi:unnamed protein product, partial [Musa acuminata var. zebrina]
QTSPIYHFKYYLFSISREMFIFFKVKKPGPQIKSGQCRLHPKSQ